MEKYKFENASMKDMNEIVRIYNSNPIFLWNHLGVEAVTGDFIINEMTQMKETGFDTLLIKNNRNEVIGFCDIKMNEETYLSLIMLDHTFHGMGHGKEVLFQLESMLIERHTKQIRIDVVDDYKENVVGFWKKQGYEEVETVKLQWNGYDSNAIKMYKTL